MVYGIVVGNNPIRFIDPYGLLTTYGGYGGSAFIGEGGNATATVGSIFTATGQAPFSGNFVTYGAEGGTSNGVYTTVGAGAGTGWTLGFFTGDPSAFAGPTSNLNFVLGPIGITYSTNDGGSGLSVSAGGKGWGLGYYINQTNTKTTYCK